MKSFDVVNAPESLVSLQRRQRNERNKIGRKTSNILEVNSASEECDSETEVLKKFEEEKIFTLQNEKPGSQAGYYSIPQTREKTVRRLHDLDNKQTTPEFAETSSATSKKF